MEALHERDGPIERITFTRSPSAFQLVFAGLPCVVAVQVLVVLVMQSLPLPLMGLLVAVVASCIALAVLVVDQFLPVKMTLADDGLRVERTWGSAVYPWHTVDGAKVVGATGTLGDNPTQSVNQRFGLGLFLRIAGAEKERDKDDNADVILYAADNDEAASLIRMCDHINAFRARLGGPQKTVHRKFGGTPAKATQLRQQKA